MSSVARVDGHRLMHAERLNQRERSDIKEAMERTGASRLFINDPWQRSVSEICSIVRRHKSRENTGLVVVDYLQLVEAEAVRHSTRQERVGSMSRRFKGLAEDLNIPVLLLSQLNRNAEGLEDKIPHLSDIRESGAVEQDANVILLLHRPKFYDANDRSGEADLVIAQNRGGQTGKVLLRYQKNLTRFHNYEDMGAF